MTSIYYKLGRKFGSSLLKGKWYYKSVFGTEQEAAEAENLMGRELARNIMAQARLSDKPTHKKIIFDIKNQLSHRITDKNRNYQFGILRSDDVNAFALPGGFIFVTDSLIEVTEMDYNELAFVLSHEVVHVILKHPFNKIIANFSSQVVAGLLSRSGALNALANRVLADLLRKTYSRDKEFEADRLGVRLMYAAGFDPECSKNLLRRLAKFSPQTIPAYNYFMTHPPIEERINRIDQLIAAKNMKQKKMLREK